jgi:hypothetical protein
MSETQAIEAEAEVEIVEVDADDENVAAAPEAIEIPVEDGEDEPTPKKAGRTETRLRNKNKIIREQDEAVNQANAATQQAQAALEASNEELKLFKLRDAQKANTAPNEDDFDDPQEYQKAVTEFDDRRIDARVDEKIGKVVQQTQQQTNQANQSQEQEKSIGEHYERADALPIKNYDELEGNAIKWLGAEFTQVIISTTDNSEEVLASIGASPKKAAALAELSKTNAAKALIQAAKFPINKHLRNDASLNTPSPETKLSPGENSQLSGWDLKLDKAREKAAVNGDLSYVIDVKKKARAAGVTL